MIIFRAFFKTQSDQNIHQNAPKCIIVFKKKFGGGGRYALELPSIGVQL